MKNIFRALALTMMVLCFTTIVSEVSATHIVGGNLTYKHIKGDTFEIRLVLRRDCFLGSPEAEFDDPARVYVFDEDGLPAKYLSSINRDPSKFFDGYLKLPFMASDTLNEYIQSDCGFEGTQVCVHQTTYLGKIILSRNKKSYTFAYQRCCRNASLANIVDPLNTGATYWTTITQQAFSLNNSTPTFNQWPDVYICANKPLVFDHSATDVDGDSLVYRLCAPSLGATADSPNPDPISYPPYIGAGNIVEWSSPYSLNDMLGGSPLKIDLKTGEMTAVPNLVGQFLVGVCVEEFRNGVRIGIVRRDFQFNVRVCSQPPLAQFTTSESNCDGLTVEFYNNSLSASSYTWNFNYPSTDAAFKSTDKDPIFTFPKSGTYDVNLVVTRGSDQCFDTIIQKVSVFENKILPDFIYQLSDCDDETDSLVLQLMDNSFFDEPGYFLSEWEWQVTQNGITSVYSGAAPFVLLDSKGNVDITVTIFASNGCKTSFTKSVNITDIIPVLDFSYELLGCPSDSLLELKLTNLSGPLNPFADITNSQWTVGTQILMGNPLTVSIPKNTSLLNIDLETSFKGRCVANLMKVADLSLLVPKADLSFTPVSCPDDGNVTINVKYIDTLSAGQAFSDISWSAGIKTDLKTFSGTSFDITIPKDSVLRIEMLTTFANGCTDRVVREDLPGPFATVNFVGGPIILCPNDIKPLVTNGNPDWTYTWSPTEGLDLTDPSNPLVSSDINRTYGVTVTDGLCTVVGMVDVTALNGGVNLAISADTVSCGGEVELNALGGIGNGVYSWGTVPSVNPVIATGSTVKLSFTGLEQTYYVTFVGDACATEPAKITVRNEAPRIDNLSPFKICKSDTTKIVTLNLVNYHQNTYVWEPNSHLISGGNSSEPTIGIGPDEVGSFVLYYTVANQFGCQLRDSVLFNINTNPTTDFTFTLTECGQYKICFEHANSFDGFNVWDFGDLTTNDDRSLEKAPCYIYPESGTYNITLSNITNVCPFLPVQKSITINPQINLSPMADKVLCVGDSLSLIASSNIQNADYTWCDVNGNVLSSTNQIKTVINENSIFILKGKDNFGCSDADTISASVVKFDFDVTLKDSFCVNEPSQINVALANPNEYGISWTPAECIISGGNTLQPIFLPKEGKPLTLALQHLVYGCTDTVSVSPKVTKPFNFDVMVPFVFCQEIPTTVNLNIENPENYNYTWSPLDCIQSGGNTSSPILKISQDKTIKVEVVNKSSGCKQNLDVDVKAADDISVNVNAVPDFTIYEGESLDIYIADVLKGASYTWSTGETDTIISVNPITNTSYQVTVTDENGCTAIDEVVVTVRNAKCDETDVYIPNAFSPNQDSNNDIFIPRSNFIDEMLLIVYNRWGQEIFKSDNKSLGWDGTFNGQDLSPDAYAYYLKVVCINAEEYVKKGNVTLIR